MHVQKYYFLFFIFFSFCCNEKDRYLGKISAPITENIYLKIYQGNDFEQFTAIDCEIVDGNDSLITGRRFLTGTDLYERNTNNFRVGEYDSIIYLTYLDSNEIIGVYDLKANKGYPFGARDYQQASLNADSLLKRLQYFDGKLIGHWNQ